MWGCIFAQCPDMHPRNTDKYCFGHLPPPCTASKAPQLRAHLRLLVVMIFAKGERNCTGRTVSEHLANRKAGKAHNKHAQMLTFSVARSPAWAIPQQDPLTPTTALRRPFHKDAQGTLPGDCHGATKTVASRNDIIRQKAFIWDASAEISPRASLG